MEINTTRGDEEQMLIALYTQGKNHSLILFDLQHLHLALAHPTPVITMVTALQMRKMKVLIVNALKAGKAKTAKLVSLIDFGVSNCQ